MSAIEARLQSMNVTLPGPAAPVANYVPCVISGNLLIVSGQLALGSDGKLAPEHLGKVGGNVSVEAGRAAARLCAINLLAQAKAALGDLDLIRRCVRLGGFICAAPGFSQVAAVMNGASDFMVEVLGDAGRHARTTVGVAELPLDCVVEVDAIFEIGA
ncbi:MAG: RidA family protein [Beijerinckiaceae bacterium]|nr:MAG: RidA family protein [Beijerinckiaceae bacterium]